MTRLYVFYGQDDFSLKEALTGLKAALDANGLLEPNTVLLEGGQLRADELSAVCTTVPFLSDVRLVIVAGLLGRFEADRQRRAGRTTTRRRSTTGPELGEWQIFIDSLPQMPASTVLVFVDGVLSSSNKLLQALQDGAEVREFRPLSSTALTEWIARRAQMLGASLLPGAIRLLSEYVGNNLWQLSAELEKLTLYVQGRPIGEEDVRTLVSATREVSVFNLVDAISAGRREEALRWLPRLFQEGWTAGHLLALLVRQYRHLLLARELHEVHTPTAEIGRRLGMASDYALRKTVEQAARHPMQRLESAYRYLLAADVAMKTGALEEELALALLIDDLCRAGVQ